MIRINSLLPIPVAHSRSVSHRGSNLSKLFSDIKKTKILDNNKKYKNLSILKVFIKTFYKWIELKNYCNGYSYLSS